MILVGGRSDGPCRGRSRMLFVSRGTEVRRLFAGGGFARTDYHGAVQIKVGWRTMEGLPTQTLKGGTTMNKAPSPFATVLSAIMLMGVSIAPPATAQSPSAEEAQVIAQESYIYLFPLILMDVTRKQLTNVDPKVNEFGGPGNRFKHVRKFPSAEMRSVVRPNFDTLYSIAWLDLADGPVIVSTADTGGRYFMLPMLDMWTDVFAVPGKRTHGTGAADFALVPPGWTGALPRGVERIDAPTLYVWIIGRTQTNGEKDYEAINKVQDGFRITLLSDWGKAPRTIEQK